MSKHLRFLLILILIMTIIILPTRASADVAPPIQPPITNLEPGTQTTNVRMLAETVLIDIQPDSQKDSLGMARITAQFTMRNLGATIETMAARFPISANNGRGEYPELSNLSIKVNSTQTQFSRVNYPDIRWQDTDVPWAEFNVTFPVGKDVDIEIAYTLKGSGYPPFTAFYYILETGAGWSGTIGSADIILRLPYPANTQNVILDQQIGWSETTMGGVFSGNELRWHFDDFEPGAEGPVQNMEFSLVSPAAWKAVLDGQSYIDQHPTDGEAWGRLAMATKHVFFMGKGYRTDPGGEELFARSVEAYEECLALKPQDAQWHAGFADLLSERAFWDSWTNGVTPDAMRAIQEISTALNLAPTDPIVLNIAENIFYSFPGSLVQTNSGYDFPWLTQTPTPFPATATNVDPVSISGEYRSELLSLDIGRKMQMIVQLQSDHSAFFEANYEDGQTIQASGDWVDNRDYSLILNLKDSDGETYKITFMWDDKGIYATEYPSIFSGPSYWELKRIILETPAPIPSETPIPTTQRSTEPTQATTSPGNPICGSTIFVPLGLIGGLILSSKTKKKRGNHP